VTGVADPNFKARLLTLGVEANPLTSRAFGQFIASGKSLSQCINRWSRNDARGYKRLIFDSRAMSTFTPRATECCVTATVALP
jgi:hypothetical protein